VEYIAALQAGLGVKVPSTDEGWETLPRTHITVRRDKLLADAMKEARKARFDPTKLLNVSARGLTMVSPQVLGVISV
jgi:hypothetical protein